MQSTLKFLKTIGFEFSVSEEILVFPYDKPIKRIMMAREALLAKLTNKLDSI